MAASTASKSSADLLSRVAHGETTPAEAEAEAKRLGLYPPVSFPPPDSLDPRLLPDWTLPMTLVWVMGCSLTEVREWSDDYREAVRDWRPIRAIDEDGSSVTTGYELAPLPPASWTLLCLTEMAARSGSGRVAADLPPRRFDALSALYDLRRALRRGKLTASGIAAGSSERVAIPALFWTDGSFIVENDRDVARPNRVPRPGEITWTELRFPSAEVQRLWPASLLPQPVKIVLQLWEPKGQGHIPLSAAAHWIATEGGRIPVDPWDDPPWQAASDSLLERMVSGELEVFADVKGDTEPVPAHKFSNCPVSLPTATDFLGLELQERLYIRATHYIDDDHWQKGIDDSLQFPDGRVLPRLRLLEVQVRALWPFDMKSRRRTGAPGRPSSMDLILGEFERRRAEGRVAKRRGDEAQSLIDWISREHPGELIPTIKTVVNRVREFCNTHPAGSDPEVLKI